MLIGSHGVSQVEKGDANGWVSVFLALVERSVDALIVHFPKLIVECLQADLKIINDGKGGCFYRDHLPLLGK